MSQILAIDLGTSSVKVALIHAKSFKTIASSSAEYPILHPKPDFAEQNPTQWWQATIKASREVLQNNPHDIIAIGLSGQMHGMVCLNSELAPIQPAIIWADRRSHKQVQELYAFQQTSTSTLPGLPATGFVASTALWFKQNNPEVLSQMAQWCLPKDYLRYKLTNIIVTEPSDAASTWLLDIEKTSWAKDVMTFCGLSDSQMPEIQPSASIVEKLTEEAASTLGLNSSIPVIAGTADLPSQALGHGIANSDTVLITIGSGGQLFIPSCETHVNIDKYYLFNSNIANSWYIQAAILSAGLSLKWLRDILDLPQNHQSYSHLSDLSQSVNKGADDLIFLPYLAGERTPNQNHQSTGSFFGLGLHHTRAHLARAVMEGVAFAIKKTLFDLPVRPKKFILAGGITDSDIWCQILADILQSNLEVSAKNEPHGCVGVAILAASALGLTNIDAATKKLGGRPKKIYAPNTSQVYIDNYQTYQHLYDAMLKVNAQKSL